MFHEKKKKKEGIEDYIEKIKEVSVRKNFTSSKGMLLENKNFLYCDPPEVILQSIIYNLFF
jgi:hypothetical protein